MMAALNREKTNIDQARVELDTYGYTILRDQIPRERALQMGSRLMEIMGEQNRVGEERPRWGHLPCLYNFIDPSEDDLFLPLITNPHIHNLVHEKLGDSYQLGGANVVWRQPGVESYGLHADVPLGWFAEQGLPVPQNITFTIQCAWMLTDFTYKNGATLLLPNSHHMGIPNMWLDDDGEERFMNERVRLLRKEIEDGDPNHRLIAAEGMAGSVVVFHGGVWHRAGANVTENEQRVGVLTPYFAGWAEPKYGMDLHESLLRDSVRARMPDQVKKMCLHVIEDYEDTSKPC
ncbi:MAG: phytanoyl-CoA dioxygenase family protein [SAR202 cluster bacterium]|jgi:hypothetical protein|nr:phytanoyl-CoA dioxygenase family protein [SAR202 cluster bacterium]